MFKKFVFLFFMSLIFVFPALAVNYDDVVYLKNGSILRGVITEQIPNESLTIETKDGNVFVYKIAEVKKITKEKARGGNPGGISGETLEDNPERNAALLVNVLGLLQFGPTLELEVKLMPSFFLVGQFRVHSAGLLSHVVTESLTMNALAFGGGVRYFLRFDNMPHALYFGLESQFGYGNEEDPDYPSWRAYFSYIVTLGEIGFRWRFDKFLVSIGGLAGMQVPIEDYHYYTTNPGNKISDNEPAHIAGMLTLSFGTEF